VLFELIVSPLVNSKLKNGAAIIGFCILSFLSCHAATQKKHRNKKAISTNTIVGLFTFFNI
jgi:hypothetical protein